MLSRRSFLQTTGAGAVAARLRGVTDPADAPALAQAQGTQKPLIPTGTPDPYRPPTGPEVTRDHSDRSGGR